MGFLLFSTRFLQLAPSVGRFPRPQSLAHLLDLERAHGLEVYGRSYGGEAFCGNLAATPPEALRGRLLPGASDVYGVAVLYFSLLTGEERWNSWRFEAFKGRKPAFWQGFRHFRAAFRCRHWLRAFKKAMSDELDGGRLEACMQRARERMAEAMLELERQELLNPS